MPALIASGNEAQALTTANKSGSDRAFHAPSAPLSALWTAAGARATAPATSALRRGQTEPVTELLGGVQKFRHVSQMQLEASRKSLIDSLGRSRVSSEEQNASRTDVTNKEDKRMIGDESLGFLNGS